MPAQLRRSRHPKHLTEGKIAIDEDRSTPIFSLYAGRVSKLLVGLLATRWQSRPAAVPVLEAGDSLQAQNDFHFAALTNLKQGAHL